MVNNLAERYRASFLWGAYGDALGFITELTDESGLKHRSGRSYISSPTSWVRRIGGRYGIPVELQSGTYSDDTQLRLATARCIRRRGFFDVEAFSKVELPVWLSYSLGAGRATKLAASSLTKEGTSWFANFFNNEEVSYVLSGGNGAAMRIQPHVLASSPHDHPTEMLLDVFRNSICTHGHPRGILGACFHALTLFETRRQCKVVLPDIWSKITDHLLEIPEFIIQDVKLRDFWLPTWERITGQKFSFAVQGVVDELHRMIDTVVGILESDVEDVYTTAVNTLNATDPSIRGSGTLTAVLANTIAIINRDTSQNLTRAANILGTDTDSICTMAGSIMGLASSTPPLGPIQDSDYIASISDYLYSISEGMTVEPFPYPDLISWRPPRTQLDAVGHLHGKLHVAGLGEAVALGEAIETKGRIPTEYQWLKLSFGQTLLIKRRKNLSEIPEDWIGIKRPTFGRSMNHSTKDRQSDMFLEAPNGNAKAHQESRPIQADIIDDLTKEAIRADFNPSIIGNHIVALANREMGIQESIAYTAIIAKALMTRKQSRRK